MKYEKKTQLIVFMLILVTIWFFPCHGSASSTVTVLEGQSVYVPIYSHIYHGDCDKPFDLTATLSIHNTDPKHEESNDHLNNF